MRLRRTFTCLTCGAEFTSPSIDAKYCSYRCSARRNWIEGRPQNTEEQFECPNNSGVICSKKECNRCGWNPDVATARSLKILEDMVAANG